MMKLPVLLCTLLLALCRVLPCWAYPGSDPFELLIVAPVDFKPLLTVLRDHKNASLMPTDIITLDEIYSRFSGTDQAEQVKRAIAHFEANNGVKYVMLVGDLDVLPVRWVTHEADNAPATRLYYYPSDLYYADLYDSGGSFSTWNFDGDAYYGEHLVSRDCGSNPFSVNSDRADFHPDVAVGRVPASTPAEVESYVAKIIRYEHRTAGASDDWFHNMTLLAAGGRLCDPGIHFNDIQVSLDSDFSYASYLDQSYYLPHADHPQRPCDCNAGESLAACMSRTGLSAAEIDIFKNAADILTNRPDAALENIGFLAYHDHTQSMRNSNYDSVINNAGRFTIAFSDGCSDGGFAGGPPGEMARFAPTGQAGGQDLPYREIGGRELNVTFADYYYDTNGDGSDEKFYQIIDCVIDGTTYPLVGDHCGGGFFPDMTFTDDFDAGGVIISRSVPYIVNAPPPSPMQPATADREFHPERKLFAKNSTTDEETGWIGLVAATKSASFPANGELESLFFQGYKYPHATVAGRNRLGDMWRSMEEYWLEEIFDAGGNFLLTGFLDKFDMDRGTWFNPYCSRSLEHAMMFNLFGDPSLRVGGAAGLNDSLPPITSCADGIILGGSGAVTIPLTVTDYGAPPSGVRNTWYRINEGSWQTSTNPTIPLSSSSASDGYYNLNFYSEDYVGNVETEQEALIGIDTYPPRTSILLDGEAPFFLLCACPIGMACECPEQGCFTKEVEVTLSAVDPPAPVAAAESAPTEIWNAPLGGTASDMLNAVRQTGDGGFILAGFSSTASAGGYDVWLVKTGGDGTKEWDKTFGGTEFDKAYDVLQATDGGYLIAGQTSSFSAGSSDGWLIKTDDNGTEEWRYSFGGADTDVIYAMEATSDGGLILAGYTESFSIGGSRDFWLIKTDSDGVELWSASFGGERSEEAWAVALTADGGYILAGLTSSFGAGSTDLWLVKTDANGVRQWDQTFGGTDEDNGYSVKQTTDNGYIIAGWTKSEGAGGLDAWLIKTDSLGNEEWRRTFGHAYLDLAASVQQSIDGGYILTGKTSTSSYVSDNLWLIKTDSTGIEEWSRTFGGTGADSGESVIQTTDGAYIVAGRTNSIGAGDNDGWLLKVAVITPDPPDIPASGIARTEYYSTAWDWYAIPTEYTGPDLIGHGNHTLRYRSVDQAGNEEDYRETSFCVLDLDATTGIIREEIRILAALKEIVAMRMRKDIAGTLPIDYVVFEYLDQAGQPTLFGMDYDGSDGWEEFLDTSKMTNGFYTLRMSAFEGDIPKDFSQMDEQAESELLYQEEQKVTVSNLADSSYLFELTAPTSVDRGASIDYVFTFKNSGDSSLYDLNLVCDLDPAFFDGFVVEDGGVLDNNGLPFWYIKEVKSGEVVKLRFSGKTRDKTYPRTLVTAQGVLSWQEVPQILSDNPETGTKGDYTAVSINPVDASISGRVADFMSGEPVSALVGAGPQGPYDLTDENGEFALTDLPAGSYTVGVSANTHSYLDPPGPVILVLDGTGTDQKVNFHLARPDSQPPVSSLSQTLDEIITGQLTTIQGTATDYQPGSGVSQVEVLIKNNSHDTYWDGSSWSLPESWLPADGTDQWSYANSSLNWDPALSYTVYCRAFDYTGNVETPQAQANLASLQPPDLFAPADGSVIEEPPVFRWSYVHDCYYEVQLDNNLDFSSPELTLTSLFSPTFTPELTATGTYYWRVKAVDQLTGTPESPWSTVWKVTIASPSSPCAGDLDEDGDVDGRDARILIKNPNLMSLKDFAAQFGRANCAF
jgi:hypothetical protein